MHDCITATKDWLHGEVEGDLKSRISDVTGSLEWQQCIVISLGLLCCTAFYILSA